MSNLRSQKEIAARVLGCGKSRVWFDPSRSEDIKEAITAEDVRRLVKDGVIMEEKKKGASAFRKNFARSQKAKGRRKGKGSFKGETGTRLGKKEAWVKRIRTLRSMLRELRDSGRIENKTYRKVYMVSKSGYIRSRAHLTSFLERNNMLRAAESGKNVSKKKRNEN